MTATEQELLRQFHSFVARLDDDPLVGRRVQEHAYQKRRELEARWPWLSDPKAQPPASSIELEVGG